MNEFFESKKFREIENHGNLDRIDGKYIWSEISSVFSFQKGIFYTIRELLFRPGKTVNEFLNHDRKRLVKPIMFVVFSSFLFIISQKIFEFHTGSAPDDIDSKGIQKSYEWVNANFGIVNVILGVFISFWIRLFYLKSNFNIYEIFVLVFFSIGIENITFTIFGILESVIGLDFSNLAYLTALLYSTWAIGNFFNRKSFWSYFKGLLAYILGTIMCSGLFFLIGILIDLINKNN
jgi:hypothetical protein